MITKEQFISYLENFRTYEDAIESISKALGNVFLWDSKVCNSVGKMLDTFLESHFNKEAFELITWFLFEDVDKVIYEPDDLFEKEKEIHLNNLSDLYDYLKANNYIND